MSRERSFTHEGYLSPFTWRYGSPEMRALWGEARKRRHWRRIWVALAAAQADAGLVSAAQVDELRAHQDDVDLDRAAEIEQEIQHDLMSEVRTFAEQCPRAGGVIHLGATSMDIEDNADVLRQREALDQVLTQLDSLLEALATQIVRLADTPTMAFTHLQPAEPTTMGYRLAQFGYDLLRDRDWLRNVRDGLRGKGLKGAVGTAASYGQLLAGSPLSAAELEQALMDALDLEAAPVATQTYGRKQDFMLLSALAALGQSLYKFAFDLRLLQSPPLGEWAEPFGAKQVGSSAMPFKRNPIHSEKLDSLARLLAGLPRVAWDNAAHSLLERTLDDSANRRVILPEGFLIADELLLTAQRLVSGLRVDEAAGRRLLDAYGAFAATERLLMEAVKRGGDRQVLHEVIRDHAMAAWPEVRAGRDNPLVDRLCADPAITALVPPDAARALMDAEGYVGDAPVRARALAQQIRDSIAEKGA